MPAALSDKTNMDEELLDCGPKLAEGQSLQDAFARFRRERKREHKLRTPSSQLVRDAAAAREAAAATPGGAEARRRALRATFIETTKQYIGVPTPSVTTSRATPSTASRCTSTAARSCAARCRTCRRTSASASVAGTRR